MRLAAFAAPLVLAATTAAASSIDDTVLSGFGDFFTGESVDVFYDPNTGTLSAADFFFDISLDAQIVPGGPVTGGAFFYDADPDFLTTVEVSGEPALDLRLGDDLIEILFEIDADEIGSGAPLALATLSFAANSFEADDALTVLAGGLSGTATLTAVQAIPLPAPALLLLAGLAGLACVGRTRG